MRRRMRRRGFTFIELAVVVLVVGILAQLALAALGPAWDEQRLGGAAREVAAALEYARQSATGNSNGARVSFTPAGAALRVERIMPLASLLGSEATLAQSAVETTSATLLSYPPDPRLSYDLNLAADSRFAGVTMSSAAFGAASSVTFDTYGAPSSSGAVVLALKNMTYTVSVAAASGAITITSP